MEECHRQSFWNINSFSLALKSNFPRANKKQISSCKKYKKITNSLNREKLVSECEKREEKTKIAVRLD